MIPDLGSLLVSLERVTRLDDEFESLTVEVQDTMHRLREEEGYGLALPNPDWKTELQRGGVDVNLTKKNYRRLKERAAMLGISVEKHLSNVLLAAMEEKTILPALPGEDTAAALNRNLANLLLGERA